MLSERDMTIDRVVDLWRRVFGEPPVILAEPQVMLRLIEMHGGARGRLARLADRLG